MSAELHTNNEVVDRAYRELLDSVYSQDFDTQYEWLQVLVSSRNISAEYLMKRGCMFIPNGEYVRYHIGQLADNELSGFYFNSQSIWQLCYIFPVTSLAGKIAGIVGWDAYNKYRVEKGEELGLPMYKVSNKGIFNRDAYFMTDVDLVKGQFCSGGPKVIFVVDGVFDGVSLCEKGVPTICLLGSTVSREVLYFLSFFDYVYVLHDNDEAGVQLYKKLKRVQRNVFAVRQPYAKDIEEYLRIDASAKDKLLELVEHPIKSDIRLTKNGFIFGGAV